MLIYAVNNLVENCGKPCGKKWKSFLKKVDKKFGKNKTIVAYKIVHQNQILYSLFLKPLLNMFSIDFCSDYSIKLLTLHIINMVLIKYGNDYKSISKVVNNLCKTYLKTIIT